MYVEPSGYQDVVTLVKCNGKYEYYVCDKELWILDLKKLKDAFKLKGYSINLVADERTGFEILTKEQYTEFTGRIEIYKVSSAELEDYYRLFKSTEQPNDDIREVLPVFYINFDENIFYSFYTEPGSYEEFIPSGWQGYLMNDCTKVIPSNMVYWGQGMPRGRSL